MARAHRVAIYASTFALVYLFALFAVLPVPFVEPDVVAQVLPVVRINLHLLETRSTDLPRFLGGCSCHSAPTPSHPSVGAYSLFKTVQTRTTSCSR